jgi:hypothetical protein
MQTTQLPLALSALALVLAVAVGACGDSPSEKGYFPDSADGGARGAPVGAFGGSRDGQAPANCAENAQGCACDVSGKTAACWTGPAIDRGRGACKDGTQTCQGSNELLSWGACVGQVTDCGSGHSSDASDAGAEAALDAGACTGDCVPGASRWCDEPTYCNWGKQTCTPQGTWGACREVNEAPTGCQGVDRSYDQNCCVRAGACCQDFGGLSDKSIGQCANIACGASSR